MKRPVFTSIILTLGYSFAVIIVSAQQAKPGEQILSQIKIESFDWYSSSEVPELPVFRNNYQRGFPESKALNIPTKDSSQQKESEKFIYRIRIRNLSEKEIVSVVWNYEFFNPLTKQTAAGLEFESRTRIKPHQRKTIYAESSSPPTQLIDVNLLLLNPTYPFLELATVKSVVFKEISKKSKD